MGALGCYWGSCHWVYIVRALLRPEMYLITLRVPEGKAWSFQDPRGKTCKNHSSFGLQKQATLTLSQGGAGTSRPQESATDEALSHSALPHLPSLLPSSAEIVRNLPSLLLKGEGQILSVG